MFFSPKTDSTDELLRVMLNWAFGGFEPLGPDGLQPQSEYSGMQQISTEDTLGCIFSIICCINLLYFYLSFSLRQN